MRMMSPCWHLHLQPCRPVMQRVRLWPSFPPTLVRKRRKTAHEEERRCTHYVCTVLALGCEGEGKTVQYMYCSVHLI